MFPVAGVKVAPFEASPAVSENDIDAVGILEPFMNPFMHMFEMMHESYKTKELAEKVVFVLSLNV